jgi:hypothetical protein
LINYLKVTTLEVDATGGIDSMTLGLVMALLYALDFSILQRREDGESKSSVIMSLNVIPSLTVRLQKYARPITMN